MRLSVLTMSLSATSIAADATEEEWRVMGPAFSYHGDKDQAKSYREATQYNCRSGTWIPAGQTAADGEKLGIPSRVCGDDWTAYSKLKEEGKLDWSCGNYVKWSEGGVYTCRFTESSDVRRWHQNNPALGLMYTRRYDDHSVSFFGTVVRDSYGTPSLMAGAAYMWPLASIGSLNVDGGFASGLWYRSVINTDTNDLHRTVIPFIFPGLSMTEATTGLGLELGLMPKLDMHFGNRQFATPMTLMAQLTYLVKKTEVGATTVSVQRTVDGGLQASLNKSF
jgi:hypothetical protein